MSGRGVTLRGISKAYPGAQRPALDGLDLAVDPGQILVLLGTSGAGKTTLLRIVAGLDAPDAGEVRIGEDLVNDPRIRVPPERRGVGFVFQHLELWPHMTVAENVAFGLPGRPTGSRAVGSETVREIADRVGIDRLLERAPATLSGGERQRVAIARTLAPDPAVVLYDEPLANLDPERRADLRRLIRTLCRERGATLLYVTHDAEEAMGVGDEIAVLSGGRVVDRGAPAALYRHPATLASARALGPVTALPAAPEGSAARTDLGVVPCEGNPGGGDACVVLRPEALRAVPGEGAVVLECRPVGPAWRVVARVGSRTVFALADVPHAAGDTVDLQVTGVGALVAAEEDA